MKISPHGANLYPYFRQPPKSPGGGLKRCGLEKGIINTQNFEDVFLKSPSGATFGSAPVVDLRGRGLEVMMKRIIL
jgi:hypothetical protein